jgi:hypothetical protein
MNATEAARIVNDGTIYCPPEAPFLADRHLTAPEVATFFAQLGIEGGYPLVTADGVCTGRLAWVGKDTDDTPDVSCDDEGEPTGDFWFCIWRDGRLVGGPLGDAVADRSNIHGYGHQCVNCPECGMGVE